MSTAGWAIAGTAATAAGIGLAVWSASRKPSPAPAPPKQGGGGGLGKPQRMPHGDGGQRVVWTPAQAATVDGEPGYHVEQGKIVRAVATIETSGLAPTVTADLITRWLEGHGSGAPNAGEWTSPSAWDGSKADPGLPADWPDRRAPTADLWYVQATRAGASTDIPETKGGSVPLLGGAEATVHAVYTNQTVATTTPAVTLGLSDGDKVVDVGAGDVVRVELPGQYGASQWFWFELGDGVAEQLAELRDTKSGDIVTDIRVISGGFVFAELEDENGRAFMTWVVHLRVVPAKAAAAASFGAGATELEADGPIVSMGAWLNAITMGDAPPDPNVETIRQTLSGKLPVDQVEQAVAAYTGLGAAQQDFVRQAAQTVAHGGPVSLTQAAPLVAGALALTGVGAPIVAIVAAAIPVVSQVLSVLGITPGPPNCVYELPNALDPGSPVCFQHTIPYGPGDPSSPWYTWDDWKNHANGMLADATLPFARTMLECPELAGRTDPLAQFVKVYNAAWKLNAEAAINGLRYADPLALLTNVYNQWQSSHLPSATLTIQPAAPPSDVRVSCPIDGYIAATLHGDTITPRRSSPPLVLNVGEKEHLPPPKLPPGPGGGGGSSSGAGGAVAATGATLFGLATAAWLALGRPASWEALKYALRRGVGD